MNDDRVLSCHVCGRFISAADILNGLATHRLVTPDSAFTAETWETLCSQHTKEDSK